MTERSSRFWGGGCCCCPSPSPWNGTAVVVTTPWAQVPRAQQNSQTGKMLLQPPCKILFYLIRRQLNLSNNVSLSMGMYWWRINEGTEGADNWGADRWSFRQLWLVEMSERYGSVTCPEAKLQLQGWRKTHKVFLPTPSQLLRRSSQRDLKPPYAPLGNHNP